MENQILRLPEVLQKTGLRRSTIYSKIKQKQFPQQVHLSERAVGWIASDVQQWIESCIVARDDGGENV